MKTIDAKVLAACTWFAYRLQQLTGRTNFFVAKFGRFMTFASLAVSIANYFKRFLPYKTSLFETIFLIVIAVVIAYEGAACEDADRAIRSGNTVLPEKMRLLRPNMYLRLWWLALALTDTMAFIVMSHEFHDLWMLNVVDRTWFSLGTVITFYFISIDPRPPQREKLRRLVPAKAEMP